MHLYRALRRSFENSRQRCRRMRFLFGFRVWGLGFRVLGVCHSATARPTHEVVVGRAVFVTWNPPTTARSRTRTGFVFCFFPFAVLHQPNRRGHRDIRVMCHSSSDVLARPRRPPPESSVESSAPESAKLFCEWQSRAESPTRVLCQVPSPSPPARVFAWSPR